MELGINVNIWYKVRMTLVCGCFYFSPIMVVEGGLLLTERLLLVIFICDPLPQERHYIGTRVGAHPLDKKNKQEKTVC